MSNPKNYYCNRLGCGKLCCYPNTGHEVCRCERHDKEVRNKRLKKTSKIAKAFLKEINDDIDQDEIDMQGIVDPTEYSGYDEDMPDRDAGEDEDYVFATPDFTLENVSPFMHGTGAGGVGDTKFGLFLPDAVYVSSEVHDIIMRTDPKLRSVKCFISLPEIKRPEVKEDHVDTLSEKQHLDIENLVVPIAMEYFRKGDHVTEMALRGLLVRSRMLSDLQNDPVDQNQQDEEINLLSNSNDSLREDNAELNKNYRKVLVQNDLLARKFGELNRKADRLRIALTQCREHSSEESEMICQILISWSTSFIDFIAKDSKNPLFITNENEE